MYGILVPAGAGDPILLRKTEVVIGRKSNCDIVLGSSSVSSQHCKLVLSGGYWYAVDLQSTNGIKVNGARVKDHRVDPGATLSVSKQHDFILNYDPEQNGASGTPPSDVLHSGDILSRSLMEKAGLQRPVVKQTWDETASTVPDMPAAVIAAPKQEFVRENKDFFSQLKFD